MTRLPGDRPAAAPGDLEAALRALLPTEPPAGTGSAVERAAEAGRWEVWQQLADVLAVDLPHPDDVPIPYTLTAPSCPRRDASVARLRRLLAGQRECT
ncbi:hypothetical protein ACIOHE_15880 [Streptomyces sp. NPDC087851]|uniref:hypothetical protein n=1 Tax=Streptomyces sp. NPDC087851 TaxID=3365810 RepID=UPI003826E0FB